MYVFIHKEKKKDNDLKKKNNKKINETNKCAQQNIFDT